MVVNRPLVLALALAALSLWAVVLAWALHAPVAAAVLAACLSPGIVVALYEALRVLDDRIDEATRRATRAALALLLVPLIVLLATAARLTRIAPW